MKKNVLKLLWVVSLVFGFTAQAFCEQVVELAYIEFPPVFSTNKDGKPEGSLIDLSDKVLTHAGYKWHGTSLPTKRMANDLVNGTIHLWVGLSTIPEFKDTTYIGESKLMEITLRAYFIGQKTPIKQKEELNEKSVIIMRGYSYGGWVNYIKDPANKIKFFETDDHTSGFKMLEAGRADYFLDYKGPADNALKDIKVNNLNNHDISSFGAYFVVSKKAPEAEKLIQNLENSYKQLVKEGKIKTD